jgi:pimeloyl-ACP methyl ester carboxylesterase
MNLNSIEQGTGQPVILLHGLFGAAKNLGQIARALAKQAQVISLDLRNHGDSPHDAAMTYQLMADDVAETLATKNISSAYMVGHSMGGKTAMTLALTHPELVEKLVVMDIAPVSYNHSYDDYAAAMLALPLTPNLTRHDADAALAGAIPEPAFRGFLLNNLILGEAPRWRVALPEIKAAMQELISWNDPDAAPFTGPTLFLRGANSDYVRPSADAKINALFPHAKRASIEGAGHWLHAEKPREVIAALEEFLF